MDIFARVVEAASFSAAARQLGLSRAAVSKRILQLEADVGVRLLTRTTRRVLPTEIGRAYYEACIKTLAAAGEAETLVRQLHAEPRGTLRISAPMSFGTLHLGPAIAAFAAKYPDLAVNQTLNDRIVSLAEENFDVALRISRGVTPNLAARDLAPIRVIAIASPAYLARHGVPREPDDLTQHRCLHYSHMTSGIDWPFRGPDGDKSVRVRSRYTADNGDVLLQAAIAGLGVTCLPTFMTWRALIDGTVVPVLGHLTVPPLTLYAVHERAPAPSAKVRVLIEFLERHFGAEPYWDAAIAEGRSRSPDTD